VHIAGFSATCSQAAAAAAAEAKATAPVCEGEEGGGEARSRGGGRGGGAHGEAREALQEERCATAAAAEVGRVRQPHGIGLARSFGLGGWDPRFWTSGVFSVVPLPQFLSFPFPNSHPFLAGLVRARLPAWL